MSSFDAAARARELMQRYVIINGDYLERDIAEEMERAHAAGVRECGHDPLNMEGGWAEHARHEYQRGVAEERERCARFVEQFTVGYDSGLPGSRVMSRPAEDIVGRILAAALRDGPTP